MSDTELLPKPSTEPVRRLEVFTGSGRRRAWTAAQKAQIVAESYEGGETVCAVDGAAGGPEVHQGLAKDILADALEDEALDLGRRGKRSGPFIEPVQRRRRQGSG